MVSREDAEHRRNIVTEPSGGGQPLAPHEALLYVLDPRNGGPDYDVMGYGVESDDPVDVWSGVQLDEVASSHNPDGSFEPDDFASYGPFELWFVTHPGPPQATTIENILYVAMNAGPVTEKPIDAISRIVILLRRYGFLKEGV